MTPQLGQTPGQTPGRTPVRDKLNINSEDAFGDMDDVMHIRQQQVNFLLNFIF